MQQVSVHEVISHVFCVLWIGMPLCIYDISQTSLFCAFSIGCICYLTPVQECALKMMFTAMFHVISLDKQMKYCPDHYVLGMQALKQMYLLPSIQLQPPIGKEYRETTRWIK